MRCDSNSLNFSRTKLVFMMITLDVIIMQERDLIFKVKFCVRLTQMKIFCLHFRVEKKISLSFAASSRLRWSQLSSKSTQILITEPDTQRVGDDEHVDEDAQCQHAWSDDVRVECEDAEEKWRANCQQTNGKEANALLIMLEMRWWNESENYWRIWNSTHNSDSLSLLLELLSSRWRSKSIQWERRWRSQASWLLWRIVN